METERQRHRDGDTEMALQTRVPGQRALSPTSQLGAMCRSAAHDTMKTTAASRQRGCAGHLSPELVGHMQER